MEPPTREKAANPMDDAADLIGAPATGGADPGDARRILASIVRGVALGDRQAFEELYRRTAAKLFGVCLRILGERERAEEVLQDAYLMIWQRAGAFDETRGTAMTWLITLTRNRAIDRLRAGGKLVTTAIDQADAIADEAPDGFARLAASDETKRLATCLAALGASDARLVRTAFLTGATYAEIAARDSVPLGTVKSRIRRALLKLRDCLR